MSDMTIEVTGLDSVKRELERLPARLRANAIRLALNKTASKAKAEINRAVTQEFMLKANEVRNAINLRRASSGNLEAVISIFGSARKRGRSMNMIHFLAVRHIGGRYVKVKRGVKAKRGEMRALKGQLGFVIRRGGGLKTIPGAFVGNKGRTIFMRTGKGRLPIEPVQVIGVSQMFNARRIRDRVMEKIKSDLNVEVRRAVDYVLRS